MGGYRKVFPCLPLNHTASRAGWEGKEATYTRNISEKLPGVSQASSGQDGGAGGQSSSHYVWIFESHINWQHPTITAGADTINNRSAYIIKKTHTCQNCKYRVFKLVNLLFVYHFTLQEHTEVTEACTLRLLLDLVSDSQTLFILEMSFSNLTLSEQRSLFHSRLLL